MTTCLTRNREEEKKRRLGREKSSSRMCNPINTLTSTLFLTHRPFSFLLQSIVFYTEEFRYLASKTSWFPSLFPLGKRKWIQSDFRPSLSWLVPAQQEETKDKEEEDHRTVDEQRGGEGSKRVPDEVLRITRHGQRWRRLRGGDRVVSTCVSFITVETGPLAHTNAKFYDQLGLVDGPLTGLLQFDQPSRYLFWLKRIKKKSLMTCFLGLRGNSLWTHTKRNEIKDGRHQQCGWWI